MLPTFHVKPSLLLFCIFFSIHKNLTEKVFLAVSIIDLVGERGSTKALTICFIRLLLAKFSQFSITLYGALVWGRWDAHLKFCSQDMLPQKITQVVVEFRISRKLLCTHYSYSANNFWEIVSKRIFIKKSHESHLKHSRKGEIRNFPWQSNHGGLPKVVNSINHS